MTTFERYGSLSKNFLQLPCEIYDLKIVLYRSLAAFVELKFWSLENKKRSNDKKRSKLDFIKKNKKRKKTFFNSMVKIWFYQA